MGLFGRGMLKLMNIGRETRKQKGSKRTKYKKEGYAQEKKYLVPKRRKKT